MKLVINQDLKPVYDLISRVRKNFPQHGKNIRQISCNVDQHLAQYNKYLWELSRKQHQIYLERAQQELDDISAVLTAVERMELMGLLSGQHRTK